MKRFKNGLNALVNRGVDRHLRLIVTGPSRSGKTTFIVAMANQLLNIHAGTRLSLLSAVREKHLPGVKRIPQRNFGIPHFIYGKGSAQLYGNPPAWLTSTRGVSEVRLALCLKSNDPLPRHFRDIPTLYLEIVDYPSEWLLDLLMLAQDCFSWPRQMTGLPNGQCGEWSAKWRITYKRLDPLVSADEDRLVDTAAVWTDYLHHCKQQGLHLIQLGYFVSPGDMTRAPVLQFFPWPDVDVWGGSELAQAGEHTNAGMLCERFSYYCEKVMRGFHKDRFLRFDHQIVLADCLQSFNSGSQALNDMCLALTQLIQSFHYGQHILFRYLFSPVIDKLLSTATKADHTTIDQHANMISLLQQPIQGARQNVAFEGISMDCLGPVSVQVTTSGIIDVSDKEIPALYGNRLSDGAPLTVYPGEVPARLPGQAFWDKQGFQFETFRLQVMDVDKPLPHIRFGTALEFLIGGELR